MNHHCNNNNSPISNVTRWFAKAQYPFGLCFAMPVRASSRKDASKLLDDHHMTEEYLLRRHAKNNNATAADDGTMVAVTSDSHNPRHHHHQQQQQQQDKLFDSLYNKEETISSNLYFLSGG